MISGMQVVNVSKEESQLIASRQLLSFLFLSSGAQRDEAQRAPSKELFSVDRLPENAFTDKPQLFGWQTRPIYDVDGLLLFWDHTLALDSDYELHVRTAASDLLRTPVWSLGAGPSIDADALINKTLSFIESIKDLKPVLVDNETTVRVVCYGYPRLGILCFSEADPNIKFVVELFDRTIIRVNQTSLDPPESVVTVWSPYDLVTRATIADFRSRWKHDITLLPVMAKNRSDLFDAIRAARTAIVEERTTNPEVRRIGQQNDHFCAAAAAQMILVQHGMTSLTQQLIAARMDTDSTHGATPINQQRAIRSLSNARLKGVLDQTASFSEAKTEVRANRPFKVGLCSHARACGGFKIEEGDKQWLYIYDPLPTEEGRIYYEAWEAGRPLNFMYVQPLLNS